LLPTSLATSALAITFQSVTTSARVGATNIEVAITPGSKGTARFETLRTNEARIWFLRVSKFATLLRNTRAPRIGRCHPSACTCFGAADRLSGDPASEPR